jgi:hypothetical protein
MITLVSSPEVVTHVSPEIVSRWLATESPNNFRLQRADWLVSVSEETSGSPAGCLKLTLSTDFTGNVGDDIACYNATTGAMLIGKVVSLGASPVTILNTDIPWVAGTSISYMNDNTLRGGYYFEGRLTINSILQSLTIIASPDSFGYADLDVSGILRIITTLTKTGDYSADIISEIGKSGKFTFEYRECWYGSDENYTAEGNTWYYAECIRSEEQGSNLYDYVASEAGDVPFLNSFENPVFFQGLPFDLSFILPDTAATELTVTIKRYNSLNTLLSTTTKIIAVGTLEGYVNSLNIDPASIEDTASYLTVEIAAA